MKNMSQGLSACYRGHYNLLAVNALRNYHQGNLSDKISIAKY